MNNIIELKDVVKIYHRGTENIHAIDNITLSVEMGEFVSITGPSGSGKTTLLNLIGCIDIPTSGSIKLDNIEISQSKDTILTEIRAKTCGFVFQQFFLLPTLTALENVRVPGLFAKRKDMKENAKELLELVGLKNRANHLPSELSGGEMQRVAIARALINNPKILLADEPTGNLDSKNAQAIIEIFNKLNQKGLTIIIVTHNIELTKQTKRIIYLKDGNISNEQK